VEKIQNQNNLDSTQTELLKTALENLILEHCLTASVYNSMVNSGIKVNFEMKNDISGAAGYNPSNKTMYFSDNSAICVGNLKEEIFHAWQDANYAGGIAQYSVNGKANIEFEAKLFIDIINIYCCSNFSESAPIEIRNQYIDWVESIKVNGNITISSSDYLIWANRFSQYNQGYLGAIVNSNLTSPEALINIFDFSNCF